jgi:hypothetical protein
VFWSWDGESAAAINRWALEAPRRHVAIVGGDPWREMWTSGGGELARRVDAQVGRHLREAGGERNVLVTLSSQGEVVPPAVVEAMRSSPAGWKYWLRLHPVNQSERRTAALARLGVLGVDPGSLEFATETPLHALLRRMDGHVSAGLSTVITEAAALGVPSVACGREATDFYRPELSSGMLAVVTTGPELLEALERQVARGRSAPAAERPRSLETMRRLLAGDIAGLAEEARASCATL